jgi:hypothetical protein
VWIDQALFIHSLVIVHSVYFPFLIEINGASLNTWAHFCMERFSLLLGRYVVAEAAHTLRTWGWKPHVRGGRARSTGDRVLVTSPVTPLEVLLHKEKALSCLKNIWEAFCYMLLKKTRTLSSAAHHACYRKFQPYPKEAFSDSSSSYLALPFQSTTSIQYHIYSLLFLYATFVF